MAKERNETKTKSKSTFCKWIGSASFYIYINFFLSAWGDRMWTFSVGLYLVTLSKGHLRLAAIFGLCIGVSVLLLGGIIGDWVDKNRRIKVVRVALFLQNFTVMLSALAVCFALAYQDEIEKYWDGGLTMLCEALILTFAVIAQLASVAHKIAIEKDWIVVVAGGKKTTLANLNAVIRAVDLGCLVLAPTVSGLIMKFASLVYSAIVLAGWNVVSVFVEYALLYKVYNMVPELAVKGQKKVTETCESATDKEKEALTNGTNKPQLKEIDKIITEETSLREVLNKSYEDIHQRVVAQSITPEDKSFLRKLMHPFITFVKSWKTYSRQKVVFAGFSLSCLYMTVLGFDSITVGFIYTNGVDEALAGVAMAVAGITGIIGTVVFTRLRPKIGLEKTGFIAFGLEIICQAFCLMSVFAPGSPFQPLFKHSPHDICVNKQEPQFNMNNASIYINDTFNHVVKRDVRMVFHTQSMVPSSFNNFAALSDNAIHYQSHYVFKRDATNGSITDGFVTTDNVMQTIITISPNTNNTEQTQDMDNLHPVMNISTPENKTICHHNKWKHEGLNISVILLLFGLVSSRAGLWMADLVITQLLQENVAECERGVVGGVQNSINQLMDLIKFGLVIFVPHIETFGYLIMISVFFMLISLCAFIYHAYRFKGYICCRPKMKSDVTETFENDTKHQNEIYKPEREDV